MRAFREFESHLIRHNLGSVQQTKTLKMHEVLADKTILLLFGLLAQLGERLPCKQEVRSSILLGSTKLRLIGKVVNTSACHAEEHRFDPGMSRHTLRD